MSSFREVEGDLLQLAKDGQFDIIAHGCNCFRIMGAGIAAKISKQFPEVYEADSGDRRTPISRLGDYTKVQYYTKDSTLTVFNLYTQFLPGRNLDYEALTLSLRKISIDLTTHSKSIGLPLIGCGIAGGDWERVKEIIKTELRDLDVTIVHFK